MNPSFLDKNIFKNSQVRLTLFYWLIISAIVLFFNVVIFGTTALSPTEISEMREINAPSDEIRQAIINARDREANSQLSASLFWLNLSILGSGGIGSYWLAKKTLEPLEQAHDLQSQFISDVSHELRTPISAMQLETEILLRDKSATKTEMRETLESNLEEVKSLESLVKVLLKLSQIDSDIKKSTINLNEVIKNRIEKFPDECIQYSATKIFLVYTNETAVDELATILIDNALKYRTTEKPIEVRIFREHRQAVLEVSNDSEEITQEKLDKLFERFYRNDIARTRNGESDGHGLGLSIAKKLVETLGADMSVRNEKYILDEKVNYKTTFKIGFNFGK